MSFESIYDKYINNSLKMKKINAGASSKILHLITINNENYLIIDFRFSKETASDFYNITNIFIDKKFCFPKVYYINNSIIICEYVGNELMNNIIDEGKRHMIISKMYHLNIDWIYNLVMSNLMFKNDETLNENKERSIFEINKTFDIIGLNNSVIINKTLNLVNDIYSGETCLCHNDFHVGNLLWYDDTLKVIDYQDIGYNVIHYDIVSLLYSVKSFLSEKDRNILLKYYYDKMNLIDYDDFLIYIKKLAFIRLCRSIRWRLEKIKHDNSLELLIEIRRCISYLKSVENVVDIHITSYIENYLPQNNLISITLCAGKGTRMNNDLPKCAVNILNKPMIEYVSNSVNMIACEKNYFVVGYKKDIMLNILKNVSVNYEYINQENQLGTGHAVKQVIPLIDNNKIVIIIMGDMPTINYNLIKNALEHHIKNNSITTIISHICKTDYKNALIIRNDEGKFDRILEHKDNNENISSNEINTGLYIFNSTELKTYLNKIDNNNSQHEYYLTDVIKLQINDKLNVCIYVDHDLIEPTGANSPFELSEIEKQFSS